MRLTIPNPLGPPLTFDSDNVRALLSPIPFLPSRRPQLRVLIALSLILALLIFRPSPPFPPSYSAEYRLEDGLVSDVGRYVKFDVPRGTGFNHQLQRVLLQHHLAVLGNRSLAFEPYVEDDTWMSVRWDRWPWRSAKVPLSAYVAGVMNGFELHGGTPRAVP